MFYYFENKRPFKFCDSGLGPTGPVLGTALPLCPHDLFRISCINIMDVLELVYERKSMAKKIQYGLPSTLFRYL